MAQPPKNTWPKTDAGTTDWESVFETSDTGFLALISKVESAAALKLGATVVIEKLFTREVDSAERARLITQLDDIIAQGGTDLAAMIKGVTDLLRTIKDIRIEKAETYIQRQKAGAAIDRRTGLLWKIDLLLKPAVFFPVGGLFVAVLSGLIFWSLQSTFTPTPKEIPPAIPQVEKQSATEEQPAPEKVPADTAQAVTESSEGALKSPATVVVPAPLVPILLKTFRWPLLTQSATVRPLYYSVVLYVKKRDGLPPVCERLPQVLDRIYQSFNATIPVNRTVQTEELTRLRESIKRAVNTILPTSTIITVDVARYGEKGFRIAKTPPYCKFTNALSKEKTSEKTSKSEKE